MMIDGENNWDIAFVVFGVAVVIFVIIMGAVNLWLYRNPKDSE